MSSMYESFQKKSFFHCTATNQSLPISQTNSKEQGLRQRLSALSVRIQPISSPVSSWAFRRSKSMSSMGESAGGSIREWWDWGWGWIMSRKPTFARDLEMNEEESAVIGCHNKGSWRHIFYKVRAEIKRLVSSNHVGAPPVFRYDSYSYSQNFDDGKNCEG